MKLTIKGIPPYDGEYTLNLAELTNGEYRRIKQMSGYTLIEYPDAINRLDTDWVTAVGAVAAARNHGLVEESIFWNATAGKISLDFSDEETGVADPPTTPEIGTPSTPSGEPSNPDSATPSDQNPVSTGIRISA